jgi:hypothetical protein
MSKGRTWTIAHRKIRDTGYCRVGGCEELAGDAAHIVPRSLGGRMNEDATVPLCRRHHTQFDAHQIDLLEHLTYAEQAEAVLVLGIERARKRLSPSSYKEGAA